MIITDKDLGLIIIRGFLPRYVEEENLNQLMTLEIEDKGPYHLAIRNGLSFDKWKYVTETTAKEFCTLFHYKEYIKLTTSSVYYSDRYDLIFEGDEESLLYWKMKYINTQ